MLALPGELEISTLLFLTIQRGSAIGENRAGQSAMIESRSDQ